MKVYVVLKTDGIYCDDTVIGGVYASKEKADAAASRIEAEMVDEIHTAWFGADWDETEKSREQENCDACDEKETESHYTEVEEHEVAE
jgi:hypothetical protein